jgi:hypothetical protein
MKGEVRFNGREEEKVERRKKPDYREEEGG